MVQKGLTAGNNTSYNQTKQMEKRIIQQWLSIKPSRFLVYFYYICKFQNLIFFSKEGR